MLTVVYSKLRANLMFYLKKAESGEEIVVTSKGRVMARITRPKGKRQQARESLKKLQSRCDLGDIISPIDVEWKADK